MPRRRHINQDAVLVLMRSYRNEALRCRKGRAYLAGSVMIGAVLDASLTALTRLYPHHVRKIGALLAKMRTLGQLVCLAKKTGWLSGNALRAAWRIVRSRNKVHADLFARGRWPPRVRAAEFDDRFGDMGEVYDALYKVVEKSLRRRMIREGLL